MCCFLFSLGLGGLNHISGHSWMCECFFLFVFCECMCLALDQSLIQGVLPSVCEQDAETIKCGDQGPHWSMVPYMKLNSRLKHVRKAGRIKVR
jgi:hypothetical protein